MKQKGMAAVSTWGELSVCSEEWAASQQDETPLSAEQAVMDGRIWWCFLGWHSSRGRLGLWN